MGVSSWLILSLLLGTNEITQVLSCPARCITCHNGIADCSKRSLVAPPKDFPENTTTVILDGNHLRVLGTRSFQQMRRLEVLRMKENKLRVINIASFKVFPNLMTLDLSNNMIGKIFAQGFEGMQKLQTLILQHNQIRSIDSIFEPTPNLFQLNLAFNSLTKLDKDDLKIPKRIHFLDLRNNKITTIHPEAFANLQRLRYLFLNNNPLVKVPSLEFSTNVLQLVDFSNCKLTHVPQQMPRSVADFRLSDNAIMKIEDSDFKNITNLRMLALNNNDLHYVANGAFTNLLDLQELWLRNNKLVYIPRALPNNLRKVYMDSNMIQEIEDGLFANHSQLNYLTIENNRIMRINNNTFKGLKFLKSLNFCGNKIKTIEAGTFDSLNNLTTLSLSNNPLEKISANAFRKLGNLTFLHISMGGEKMILEQNFLPEMPNLQELKLMNSPGLAKAFVQLLDQTLTEQHSSLAELDMTYNDLSTLTPKMQQLFPNLKTLFLDGNSWLCDKRLAWLNKWMATSQVKFWMYEELTCEHPLTLKGRLISELNDDEFVEVAPAREPISTEQLTPQISNEQSTVKSSTAESSVTTNVPEPGVQDDDSANVLHDAYPESKTVQEETSTSEKNMKSLNMHSGKQKHDDQTVKIKKSKKAVKLQNNKTVPATASTVSQSKLNLNNTTPSMHTKGKGKKGKNDKKTKKSKGTDKKKEKGGRGGKGKGSNLQDKKTKMPDKQRVDNKII